MDSLWEEFGTQSVLIGLIASIWVSKLNHNKKPGLKIKFRKHKHNQKNTFNVTSSHLTSW